MWSTGEAEQRVRRPGRWLLAWALTLALLCPSLSRFIRSSWDCGLFTNYLAPWQVVPELVALWLPPPAKRILYYLGSPTPSASRFSSCSGAFQDSGGQRGAGTRRGYPLDLWAPQPVSGDPGARQGEPGNGGVRSQWPGGSLVPLGKRLTSSPVKPLK